MKKDEDSLSFEKKYYNKKAELDQIHSQLESQKEENLKKKQLLLDQIRALTEGELNNETFSQFKQIEEFFESMPKLSHEITVTNPKTGVKSTVVLEGLSSFFA